MSALERFLQYLRELVRLAALYHGGAVDRQCANDTMMPWAIKLVYVLSYEMTGADVKAACLAHPDAERVIHYARL